MYQTAYNSTDRPIVIDDDGRQLAGHEFGPVDVDQVTVKEGIASEAVILQDDKALSAASSSDQAKEAAQLTASYNSQAQKRSSGAESSPASTTPKNKE